MQFNKCDYKQKLRLVSYKSRSGLEVLLSEPMLAMKALYTKGLSSIRRKPVHKILVGTHHKVLTKFMDRVFSAFAICTNRTISVGMAEDVDYDADIIFDHHSQFDFSRINDEYLGIHFRRDPRDLVVSAGFYHKHSDEPQLHVPMEKLGGKTYQEHVNAMDSMEDVFLFELDHSAGMNIRHMLQWDYDRGFVELKYEDLVVPNGGHVFRRSIEAWPLPTNEKALLESLFDHYSVFGGKGGKNRHVRDPRSKQFEEHFKEKLQKEFDSRFMDAPKILGYE